MPDISFTLTTENLDRLVNAICSRTGFTDSDVNLRRAHARSFIIGELKRIVREQERNEYTQAFLHEYIEVI